MSNDKIPGIKIEIIPNQVSTDTWWSIKSKKIREDKIREDMRIMKRKLERRKKGNTWDR